MRPPKHKKLPVVLSLEEVFRVLSAIRFPVYRARLSTIYSCGLRLSEGAFLKIKDIPLPEGYLAEHRSFERGTLLTCLRLFRESAHRQSPFIPLQYGKILDLSLVLKISFATRFLGGHPRA